MTAVHATHAHARAHIHNKYTHTFTFTYAHTNSSCWFGGIICNCIYIEATASVAVMLYAKMHFRAQISRQNCEWSSRAANFVLSNVSTTTCHSPPSQPRCVPVCVMQGFLLHFRSDLCCASGLLMLVFSHLQPPPKVCNALFHN